MIEITVAMRAHRNLRRLPNYRNLSASGIDADERALYPLAEDESVLGVYENVPGSLDRLVFTDRGVHLGQDHGWLSLPYETMSAIDTEGGEKLADDLEIRLRDGSTALVPILGGDPERGTKDTSSMRMFLQGVLLDRERRVGVADTHPSPPAPIVPAIPGWHAAR